MPLAAMSPARSEFCARHRPAYGIALVACGVVVTLASFSSWMDQEASLPVIGIGSLLGTSIFVANNFFISRVCATHKGIQRVAWLGLVNRLFPFESLIGIDIVKRPGLIVPATTLEIRLHNGTFSLSDKEYSRETLRALIECIIANSPEAPVSETAKRYANVSL
jgi:hypothetical protein